MAGPFALILERAIALRGEAELEASLPSPASAAAMRAAGDDAYLREMARCVFRSGFVWQVVESKWDGFENAFAGFNPKAVAHFADERLEAIAQNASVIRNLTKIRATRDNAEFVLREAERHGSFGAFIADWPGADIVGLQLYLRKEGGRLGGHTGQYFLRFMGKDTFMFSKDVVSVLVAQGVVGKEPTSKKALTAVQEAFNAWQADETGRPFCQLSRIMAASVG